MIDWYLKSRTLLDAIRQKATDALRKCEADDKSAAKAIADYLKTDFKLLQDHWHSMFPDEKFGYLGRHVAWGEKNDFFDIITRDLPETEKKLDQHLAQFKKSLPGGKPTPYVDESRIEALSDLESENFDTSKLIRLLRELNVAYENDSFLTIGVLLRAVIDHVPPIFGCANFSEIANNYKGAKSFKQAMKKLDDSLRNLADSYLHVQIRKIESLPTLNQIDFRSELDVLLGETIRILQA